MNEKTTVIPESDASPQAPPADEVVQPRTRWRDRMRRHRAGIAVACATFLVGGLAGFGLGHVVGDDGPHGGWGRGPGMGRHHEGMGPGPTGRGGPGRGKQGTSPDQQTPDQPGSSETPTPTPSPSASPGASAQS